MQNSISEEEEREFLSYVYAQEHEEEIKLILGAGMEEEFLGKELPLSVQDRILDQILLKDKSPKTSFFTLSWLKYAAVLLIGCFAGIYVYTNYRQGSKASLLTLNSGIAIKAGKNKAILTLADGSTIDLDEAKDGEIAKQAGFSVTKNRKGQLIYTVVPNLYNLKESTALNTITTPRGGQYQVILPDGTAVWLNAASSLKYPAVFTAGQRKVELSGEAYFEVSKDKTRPFIVKTSKQQVEVLGTHFNINSYADETDTKTDLFEGAVRVTVTAPSGMKQEVVLKPAQQSVVQKNKIFIQPSVEKEVLAWKEGYFVFNHESIENIMRKVARWYDVEVLYRGNVQQETFTGKVSKYENVIELLKVLERTETIHFKIEGRKIIVSP